MCVSGFPKMMFSYIETAVFSWLRTVPVKWVVYVEALYRARWFEPAAGRCALCLLRDTIHGNFALCGLRTQSHVGPGGSKSHKLLEVSFMIPSTSATAQFIFLCVGHLGTLLAGFLLPIFQRTCLEGQAWPVELKMTKIKGNLSGLTPLKGTEPFIYFPLPSLYLYRDKNTFMLTLMSVSFTQEPCCSVTLEEGRKWTWSFDTFKGFLWFLERCLIKNTDKVEVSAFSQSYYKCEQLLFWFLFHLWNQISTLSVSRVSCLIL